MHLRTKRKPKRAFDDEDPTDAASINIKSSRKKQQQQKRQERRSARRPSPISKKQDPFVSYNGEKVWIRTLTLSELKDKQQQQSNRKQLLRISSGKERQRIYDVAAEALAGLEKSLLPTFGDRAWTVTCRITDSKNSTAVPFFRWYRGNLELACWPHLMERIPEPPNFPKQCMNDEEESTVDERIRDLQQRTPSLLSSLAWEQRNACTGVFRNCGLPVISLRWKSPTLDASFTSRKAAWDHAMEQCQTQLFLTKWLSGVGISGKPLQPQMASVKTALRVGKARFLRDGLWIVGQEAAWQEARQEEMMNAAAKRQKTTSTSKRPLTALGLFLQCRRETYRVELASQGHESVTLRQAETELRKVWKSCMTDEQRQFWIDESAKHDDEPSQCAADQEEERREEMSNAAAKSQNTTSSPKRPFTALTLFLRCRRESYRDELASQRQEPVTLRQAETELRKVWKSCMTGDQHQYWIDQLEKLEKRDGEPSPCAVLKLKRNADLSGTVSALWQVSLEKAMRRPVVGEACMDVEELLPVSTPPAAGKACLDVGELGTLSKPSPVAGEACLDVKNVASKSPHEAGNSCLNMKEISSKPVQIGAACLDVEEVDLDHSSVPVGQAWRKLVGAETTKNITGTATEPAGHDEYEKSQATSVAGTAFAQRASHQDEEAEVSSRDSSIMDAVNPIVSPSPPHHAFGAGNNDDHTENEMDLKPPALEKRTHRKPSTPREPSHKKTPTKSKKRTTAASFTPPRRWCMSEEQVKLCYDAAMDHYDRVARTIKARDLSRELMDGFDLLRERGRGRFDMELPEFDTNPAFRFLMEGSPWMPVVREILGPDAVLIHKGVFLSMPGSAPQGYHQDGLHLTQQHQRPCHAINVFVPLVDLTSRNGPTEFCLGSHVLGNEDYDRKFVFVPTVKAGTPIVFDYRLGHRGLGNSSTACRPIAYCTYAAAADGKEFRDSVNFSRRRYHKLGPLLEKPLSREERVKKRRESIELQQQQQEEEADADN